MKFGRKHMIANPDTSQEHDQQKRQLQAHERRLQDMAKRLRVLEIEAGIYKPTPLRREQP